MTIEMGEGSTLVGSGFGLGRERELIRLRVVVEAG